MFDEKNIVLVDEGEFSFRKNKKIVKINRAAAELRDEYRKIIFEYSLIALEKYLDLIKEKYRTRARSEALSEAYEESSQNYGPLFEKIMHRFKSLIREQKFDGIIFNKSSLDYPAADFFESGIADKEKTAEIGESRGVLAECDQELKNKFERKEHLIDISSQKELISEDIAEDVDISKLNLQSGINLEKCGVESLAFYAPHHFYREDFGIYLKLKNILDLILDIANRTDLSNGQAAALAVKLLLKHEHFHYLVELYASVIENGSGRSDIYKNYHDIYNRVFRTDKCYEEALANAHIIQSSDGFSPAEYQFLDDFFGRQPDGYNMASGLSSDDRKFLYLKLEEQMRGSSLKLSQLEEIIMPLELAELKKRSKFMLPVYLIDNVEFLKDSNWDLYLKYLELKEIFFPGLSDDRDELKSIVNLVIKLKDNLDKDKIDYLIMLVEDKHSRFGIRSPKLSSELQRSNYSRISVLSYTWLAGWSNTDGSYKAAEAEVNELCRELFGYELERKIEVNQRTINLKAKRDNADDVWEDIVDYHESMME